MTFQVYSVSAVTVVICWLHTVCTVGNLGLSEKVNREREREREGGGGGGRGGHPLLNEKSSSAFRFFDE